MPISNDTIAQLQAYLANPSAGGEAANISAFMANPSAGLNSNYNGTNPYFQGIYGDQAQKDFLSDTTSRGGGDPALHVGGGGYDAGWAGATTISSNNPLYSYFANLLNDPKNVAQNGAINQGVADNNMLYQAQQWQKANVAAPNQTFSSNDPDVIARENAINTAAYKNSQLGIYSNHQNSMLAQPDGYSAPLPLIPQVIKTAAPIIGSFINPFVGAGASALVNGGDTGSIGSALKAGATSLAGSYIGSGLSSLAGANAGSLADYGINAGAGAALRGGLAAYQGKPVLGAAVKGAISGAANVGFKDALGDFGSDGTSNSPSNVAPPESAGQGGFFSRLFGGSSAENVASNTPSTDSDFGSSSANVSPDGGDNSGGFLSRMFGSGSSPQNVTPEGVSTGNLGNTSGNVTGETPGFDGMSGQASNPSLFDRIGGFVKDNPLTTGLGVASAVGAANKSGLFGGGPPSSGTPLLGGLSDFTSTPFSPSQQPTMGLPQSLAQFGSGNEDQTLSGIATKGVYGGGNGPEEQKYFLNLVNNRLVDPQGKVGDMNQLNPIENSYLAQLGLGGYGNTSDLLQGISNFKS